jgi:hypothetical protein
MHIFQTANGREVITGHRTNPEKLNNMIPPKMDIKIMRGCICTACPKRRGRRRLSTMLLTRAPNATLLY